MRSKREWMHVDRADEVAVAAKAALAARPSSSFGPVTMPAPRTPTRGPSFGAGRARDASLFRFVGQVIDVLAVLPPGHPLVVVSPFAIPSNAVRVADEEHSYSILDAKVDHVAGGFVPQVAHAPLGPAADLVLRSLELLPAPRVLLAPALLLGELSQLLGAPSLETTDAAPGDNEPLTRAGRDGGKVDFPRVHGGLDDAGSLARLRGFHANVQLEATVPDECAGPSVLGKIERQDQGRIALAQRQDDAPLLSVDGLGGPLDRVERLGAPRVLHAHLGVLFAEFPGRLDVRKKGMDDLLHRLGIEGEAALGDALQLMTPRPRRVAETRRFVGLHAQVPDLGRLYLRRFEVVKAGGRETAQAIHANCFHKILFFLFARNTVIRRIGGKPGGVAFTSSPGRRRALPLHFVGRATRQSREIKSRQYV